MNQKTSQTELDFFGCSFEAALDSERLTSKRMRILGLMKDGKWRTPSEISNELNLSQFSDITRRIREAHTIGYSYEKRRKGNPKLGIWEYRIFK